MGNKKTWKEASWYAAYYKWMFRGQLPNSICVFTWNTIFSILFLPFTMLLGLIALTAPRDTSWWDNPLAGKVFYGILTWLIFFIASAAGIAAIDEYLISKDVIFQYPFFIVLLIGILGALGCGVAILIIIFSVVGVMAGIGWTYNKIKDMLFPKKYRKVKKYDEDGEYDGLELIENEPSKIRQMWDAFMNKYCTKIEWE